MQAHVYLRNIYLPRYLLGRFAKREKELDAYIYQYIETIEILSSAFL